MSGNGHEMGARGSIPAVSRDPNTACCGACAHAAEVARAGGAAPNLRDHLAFRLDAAGAPVGAELVLRRGSADPLLIPVRKARVVLGRTAGADIVVDDVRLSRRQCAFDFSTGEAVIEDLQSMCGTYVNGEAIGNDRRALREGDVVGMVDLQIEVRAAR